MILAKKLGIQNSELNKAEPLTSATPALMEYVGIQLAIARSIVAKKKKTRVIYILDLLLTVKPVPYYSPSYVTSGTGQINMPIIGMTNANPKTIKLLI
jgi:hypothetical protein